MADVAITRRPSLSPVNLSLSREGKSEIIMKWGVPVNALWTSQNDRWTGIDMNLVFNASKNMSSKVVESRDQARYVTADRLWVRDLGTASSHTQPYDRNAYHPLTNGRYLQSFSADVYAFNGYGERHVYGTYTFYAPKQPEIEEPKMDSTTGRISATIKTDPGDDNYERYDTQYCITRQDNFTSTYKSEQIIEAWKYSTDTEINAYTDKPIADEQSLTAGQWIKIRFKALARGVNGDSATTIKEYVISRPAKATISGITISDVSDPSGIVTVRINTNKSSTAVVDSVALMRYIGTAHTVDLVKTLPDSSWASVATASWETTDGDCNGLTDSVGDAMSSTRGYHTWYRLKTTHNQLISYSDPVEAKALYRATVPQSDDKVSVESITPGDDGTSLTVVVGWDDDDSVGTEVSWSEYEDAWNSTSQPTTYNVTWKDDQNQSSSHANSATLVIRGLTEGTKYYVKARRYGYGSDGSTIVYADGYGLNSDSYPVIPVTRPYDVQLTVPDYIERGSDLETSWTFLGASKQTGWNLYKVSPVDGSRILIGSGDDSAGSAVISSEQLWEGNYSVTVEVSVTTGGLWTSSEQHTVNIADKPGLIAVTDQLLMAQPMQFYSSCDSANAMLVARVKSKGVFSSTPSGDIVQMDGDVVWSEKFTPGWYINDEDGKYYAVTTLPMGLAFHDFAKYELSVTAIDTVTGMQSDEQLTEFSVLWAHQARRPGPGTRIESLANSKSVRIIPEKPENYVATDVYDVYRTTPDGHQRIATGVGFDASVVDRYAPFSNTMPLSYRLVTRTSDGDIDWCDIPYSLSGYAMRFDWDESEYLELPYNLTLNDKFTKDFESRHHLDGSVSGYWNESITRKGSFKTELVKLSDPEQIKMVRKLATYPGVVFVRLPNGCAYACNLTVNGPDEKYLGLTLDVNIDAEEITLTDEFKTLPEDIEYSSGEEPEPEVTYDRSQILRWNSTVPKPNERYRINEEPDGDVRVALCTSMDAYSNPFTIPNAISGKEITLGSFSDELLEYIAQVSLTSSPMYLLRVEYNVSPIV